MNFNTHSEIKGQHAFLGASKYHWVNYDLEKLTKAYFKYLAVQKGTELHEFASRAIELGIRLPETKQTLNMYVNDAIGYKMTAEQPLFYSYNCFGTADAICFRDGILRIHDFKSGETPCSMQQLMIYAALFCLEYRVNPNSIEIELRIYQNNEVEYLLPEKEDVLYVMDKIVMGDKRIEEIKQEG